MSKSPLTSYEKISPNHTSPRNHAIDTITPHCYVGQVTVEDMASWLCNPSAQASASYGIGKDGRVGMFVDENDRSWCSSNRENDNRAITIECASDRTDPYAINDKVYNSLLDLMTDICQRYGKKKLLWLGSKAAYLAYKPADDEMLMSVHRWYAAKACPGDYIYNRLGAIATEVTKRLSGSAPVETHLYRVRASWDRPETQTGAFESFDNAKAEADRHPGYSVYDENGKCLYTSKAPEPGKYPSGLPASKEAYIETCGAIAHDLMAETGILASVVVSQCCLETGFGLGADSVPLMEVSNLLGMKTDLINSTWAEYSVWHGKSITKQTPEYRDGKLIYITDSFRAYTDYENCIRDYEAFLLHVRNNKGYKYRRIQGWTDPAAVIHAIRIGTGTDAHPEGYCTDPEYAGKILNLIKEYNLDRFNTDYKPDPQPQPAPQPEPTPSAGDRYVVRKSFEDSASQTNSFNVLENAVRESDRYPGYNVYEAATGKLIHTSNNADKYVVRKDFDKPATQTNTFSNLDNAKREADRNPGCSVYDLAGNALYPSPVLGCMAKMQAQLEADIKALLDWIYSNTGCSGTFDAAVRKGNRKANCATIANWALRMLGVTGKGMYVYGKADGSLAWNIETEAAIRDKCDVIHVNGKKTAKQAEKEGILIGGDICTYQDFLHTNVYAGNGHWYDAGRGNTRDVKEGSPFKTWFCKKDGKDRLAYIIRVKSGKKVYRVHIKECGSEKSAAKVCAACKSATGFDAFYEYDGKYRVFCGSFEYQENAEVRRAIIANHGYTDASVRKVLV